MKKNLTLSLLLLLLVGCNNIPNPSNNDLGGSTEKITEKTIVTSFYPLSFLTNQIVGSNLSVLDLAGSAGVHDYEPSPQDMVQINKADLVIFQGARLEPWTKDVIPELSTKGILTLEVSHDLDLTKMEEHESHEEEEEEEEEEEGHDHGEFDPHTWLDPVLAQDMIDSITKSVIKISPENKDVFEERAAKLKERFAAIDKEYSSSLSQCKQDEVIISHDAFGYIARRYAFETHAIAGLSTQDEPSAKVLAELKEEADEGLNYILVEENSIRNFAETLANETGLEMLPINPLGQGTLDINKDFFDIIEENLNSFKTALDCQ